MNLEIKFDREKALSFRYCLQINLYNPVKQEKRW